MERDGSEIDKKKLTALFFVVVCFDFGLQSWTRAGRPPTERRAQLQLGTLRGSIIRQLKLFSTARGVCAWQVVTPALSLREDKLLNVSSNCCN